MQTPRQSNVKRASSLQALATIPPGREPVPLEVDGELYYDAPIDFEGIEEGDPCVGAEHVYMKQDHRGGNLENRKLKIRMLRERILADKSFAGAPKEVALPNCIVSEILMSVVARPADRAWKVTWAAPTLTWLLGEANRLYGTFRRVCGRGAVRGQVEFHAGTVSSSPELRRGGFSSVIYRAPARVPNSSSSLHSLSTHTHSAVVIAPRLASRVPSSTGPHPG